MTLKHQKDIRLINNCDAIYDEDLLKKAILWYSATPVQQGCGIKRSKHFARIAQFTQYKQVMGEIAPIAVH